MTFLTPNQQPRLFTKAFSVVSLKNKLSGDKPYDSPQHRLQPDAYACQACIMEQRVVKVQMKEDISLFSSADWASSEPWPPPLLRPVEKKAIVRQVSHLQFLVHR